MSEAKNRGKKREIAKESLLQMFRKKFEELAPICRDRIITTNDDTICTHHDSSPTDCRFSICPRLDLPLSETARIEEEVNPKRRGKS